jgi:prepilin-type N-terminal cleavage/methylation domain-containing protein
MQSKGKREGFTLIELLIVVAIIAILAAIAVPNFLEAQVRARVSKAQTDLRTVATGMEAYRVDWNSLPLLNSWTNQAGGAGGRRNMNPGALWWALTTPVAYLTSALVDPFVAIGHHSQDTHAGDSDLLDAFLQISTGFIGSAANVDTAPKSEWLGMSYGPDSADDTNLNGTYPYTRDCWPYDPTNGTASWGDIYRHGGKVPVNFISGSQNLTLGHGSNANNRSNVTTEDPYRWTH